MQKRIAILLLSIGLLSHTELHQLLKIPILVEHFREHRRLDGNISFFEFIKLHYHNIVVDDDYQRDQQLPFRDTECFGVTASNACEFFSVIVEICPPEEMTQQFHPYVENNKSRLALSGIFQPPRHT